MILNYEVFRGNPADNTILADALDEHERLCGHAPQKLAGDRRFYSTENERLAESDGVKFVAFPKSGRLSDERHSWQNSPWFKKLQRFRAGIEGNLSKLLRKFGLKRCLWKEWEAFCSYVGVAVLAYNLWKIALLAV